MMSLKLLWNNISFAVPSDDFNVFARLPEGLFALAETLAAQNRESHDSQNRAMVQTDSDARGRKKAHKEYPGVPSIKI